MTDTQLERGQQWLEQLLDLIGISAEVKIGKVEEDDHHPTSCWLIIDESNLTTEQNKLLIGMKGENIDAIQYLANSSLNIGVSPEEQRSFTIELNGYRLRRHAELFALAQTVAKRVRETGQPEDIKDLSSAERRQVHTFLEDSEDLITESHGQEPDRRLMVKLR